MSALQTEALFDAHAYDPKPEDHRVRVRSRCHPDMPMWLVVTIQGMHVECAECGALVLVLPGRSADA